MKPIIAITQRVDISRYGERRDALDQRWYHLIMDIGATPLCLPNHPKIAIETVQKFKPCGLLLTGGNDLVACGGTAPERDNTELGLLEWAEKVQLPTVGVCRGMQVMAASDGGRFNRVQGHAGCRVNVTVEGEHYCLNSYHNWDTMVSSAKWEVWARSRDGVTKAIRHRVLPWIGIMWHPEREEQVSILDRTRVFSTFRLDRGQVCER